MNKYYIRYFGGLLSLQERWLNKMASKGYRLIKTGILFYQFVPCEKDKYVYRIEFIANRSKRELLKYIAFLNDFGYRAVYKNMNLSYSFGKIRFRPWAWRNSVVTSFSTYNKELLIIEKENDGEPFEIYSSLSDKKAYYKDLRASYFFLLLFFAILFILDKKYLFLLMSILSFIPFSIYQYMIMKISREEKIQE